MAYKRKVCCYRTGPIEGNPGASFHVKNQVDEFLIEAGFEIVGDTFEHLERMNRPQSVYGIEMKKMRDQGLILAYSEKELLLVMSFKKARRSDFIISRPAPTASGGTTSETVISWLKGVPKLVIIGPHHEGILDNNSTFMIRMLTGRYDLVFDTERHVINFIKKHIKVFHKGRNAIRELIANIKKENPRINDRPRKMWDEFEGKAVIILGWPGAGKDTQGRFLQDLCGFKFFGSGHELRHLHAGFPDLKESLGEGNLAPPWVIINRITQKLISLAKFEPIVFAGTPKMLVEAQMLADALSDLGRKPIVIVIDINEELSRKRIINRRNCDNCEECFYGEEFVRNPICPRCQGPLSERKENMNEGAIAKIFSWYKTDVEKTTKFFEDMGVVTHIDGHRTKEEIFEDILNILKK